MVEEFEDITFNLNINQVSDVFRTRFGFHIAKLYDRKPSQIAGFDKVKNHIENQFTQKARMLAIDEFVDKLKADARIE